MRQSAREANLVAEDGGGGGALAGGGTKLHRGGYGHVCNVGGARAAGEFLLAGERALAIGLRLRLLLRLRGLGEQRAAAVLLLLFLLLLLLALLLARALVGALGRRSMSDREQKIGACDVDV